MLKNKSILITGGGMLQIIIMNSFFKNIKIR